MGSQLDPKQIIRKVYDDENEVLKTSATVTSGSTEVIISSVDDSIKLGNASGDFAKVNTDGTLEARVKNSLVTVPYDAITLTLTNSTTETYYYKTGGASGTIVATVTVTYTDATKNTLTSVVKT